MSLSASRLLRDEYLMDINPILCCLDPLESDVFYVLAQCNKNKIFKLAVRFGFSPDERSF